MRCRECLVEIDVHNVKSHITWTTFAQHGIEVGSIIIEQTATFMYKACNLGYLGLKDAESIGVCHHDTGNGVVEQWFQILNVDSTLGS